jgi:hypothetical protein
LCCYAYIITSILAGKHLSIKDSCFFNHFANANEQQTEVNDWRKSHNEELEQITHRTAFTVQIPEAKEVTANHARKVEQA